MDLKIKINLDNAAFYVGSEEVYRILTEYRFQIAREAVHSISGGESRRVPLRDINGNTVGHYEVTSTEPDGPALVHCSSDVECPHCGVLHKDIDPIQDGAPFDIECKGGCGEKIRVTCEWYPTLAGEVTP